MTSPPPRTTRTTGLTPEPGRRVRLWAGLAVAVLLLGHLLPVYVFGGGVRRLDWNSMAARWASGIGPVWDLALVWVTAGYAGLLLLQRRRAGRSGLGFVLACMVVALAIGVFATVAIVSTDTSLT